MSRPSNPNGPSGDRTLCTERLFSASPQEIFAAFEEPRKLAGWWGPAGFTNTFETFEFKPGGRWTFMMHAPNGANYPNEIVFGEIQRNALITIEHIVQPWFRLTIKLIPAGKQTRLTWAQQFESAEVADRFRPLAATANEQNLDRLEALLASERP